MKLSLVITILAVSAFAQPRQTQQAPKVVQAQPQLAQSVTFSLSADLATSLETMRLNLLAPPTTDPVTGVVTQTPAYATIQAMLDAVLRGPAQSGGLFTQIVQRFPPASVQSAQAAQAAAAAQAADAAQAATQVPATPATPSKP